MILLVPISPEVPRRHRPKTWPGLLMVMLASLSYFWADGFLTDDKIFTRAALESHPELTVGDPELENILRQRPLLKITPSKGSWDGPRVLAANFVHGNLLHLFLNLIGIFAGARICSTFVPFLCSLSIFILGGTLGLFGSIILSREASAFIPHLGASAGIFALMGTYYVYNFRFRTRYFFWFPGRQRQIVLRTSTYFFIDVLMIEVLLTLGQLAPNRQDGTDHLAHIIGFLAGCFLAYVLRRAQRWPRELQVRTEFLLWARLRINVVRGKQEIPLAFIPLLLEVNPYNDRLKIRLLGLLRETPAAIQKVEIQNAFQSVGPTFCRIHVREISSAVESIVASSYELPSPWLRSLPYDSMIRILRELLKRPRGRDIAYRFLKPYGDLNSRGPAAFTKILEMLKGPSAEPLPFPQLRSDRS